MWNVSIAERENQKFSSASHQEGQPHTSEWIICSFCVALVGTYNLKAFFGCLASQQPLHTSLGSAIDDSPFTILCFSSWRGLLKFRCPYLLCHTQFNTSVVVFKHCWFITSAPTLNVLFAHSGAFKITLSLSSKISRKLSSIFILYPFSSNCPKLCRYQAHTIHHLSVSSYPLFLVLALYQCLQIQCTYDLQTAPSFSPSHQAHKTTLCCLRYGWSICVKIP